MIHFRKQLISCFVLLALLNLTFITYVQASPAIWEESYGGENSDFASAMVQTSDGGYAITGFTTSFGAGKDDVWLVKTDATGNVLFNQTFGGEQYDIATALVETSDGGLVIAGSTSSFGEGANDFYLTKTDSSGNILWSYTYGGEDYDNAFCLVETSDGGLAIGGTTSSFGSGGTDYFLIKTDESGSMLWSNTYGGEDYDDFAFGLVETSDGGLAMVGSTKSYGEGLLLIKTDSTGNVSWSNTYQGFERAFCMIETSNGGLAIAGGNFEGGSMLQKARTLIIVGMDSEDFWMLKLDSQGNILWNQTYGGDSLAYATSIVETSDGGFAIAGSISSVGAGADDYWLVKTDPSGEMLWNQTYGGTETDNAIALVESADGGFAIFGNTNSFGAGEYDFYLVKTDEYGYVPEFTTWTLIPLTLATTAIILLFRTKKNQSNSKLN